MTVTGTPTSGDDTLVGDGADDTISSLAGNDNIDAGAGDDVVYAGAGNDIVEGGAGNDKIYAGEGNDVLHGGLGHDRIEGQGGNDILFGGQGNDALLGGSGDDVLIGGAGADRLWGGAGGDTFVLQPEPGVMDTIHDFAVGFDSLDVSNLTNSNGDPVGVNDVAIYSTNGGASSIIVFPDGTSVRLYGVTTAELDTDAELMAVGIPCLTRSTKVSTPNGEVAVEDLQNNDQILCRCERGGNLVPATIQRVYSRRIKQDELRANPKLYPVKISKGSLGNALPRRDLWVSRQHRMLTKSRVAERMFGRFDVLVSAIKLSGLADIFVDNTVNEVEYFHILLDTHAIIIAEGALTESLYTGKEALKTLSQEAREEIYSLFPELQDPAFCPETACPVPANKKQNRLIERLAKNSLVFVEA